MSTLTSSKMLRSTLFIFGALVVLLFVALSLWPHSHASSDRAERSAFMKTLRSEMKQLNRRQSSEIAELKAAQKAERKNSESEMRSKRRQCFSKATQGSEKRTCVQDFLASRKSFRQIQREDFQKRKNEHMVQRRALEEEHQRRLRDFDSGVTTPVDSPTPATLDKS
ncbi:MAG: hypothetical protein KGQ59_04845 [Bdellovibrionales bacterium]|nr:hypothetical protein [Bdellovibrionales bacterium]